MKSNHPPICTNANPDNSKFTWHEIYDFDSEALYRSDPFKTDDFTYYILKSVRENDNWDEDEPYKNGEGKFLVSIHVIAPKWIPKKEKEDAIKCGGREDLDPKNIDHMLETYFQYGCGTAIVSEDWFNDLEAANIQMNADAFITSGLLGFIMDRQLNGFGATGWDLLRCNPFGSMKRKMVKK